MKVSSVSLCNYTSAQRLKSNYGNRICENRLIKEQPVDEVSFKGKFGKVVGGMLGGAAGGAAGGAIISGGSLAAIGSVIALGPVGAALAAAYTIGGALAGGYMGSSIGDMAEGDD